MYLWKNERLYEQFECCDFTAGNSEIKNTHITIILLNIFVPAGRKIERSLSAKRKESSDAFIPTKPLLVKSKTLDRPPSKDSWDTQSKLGTFNFSQIMSHLFIYFFDENKSPQMEDLKTFL